MIDENIKSVTQRIIKSCEKSGRASGCVELVCVTKEAGLADIETVLRSGVKDLGENRVPDALAKYAAIGSRARWHMIGHLQTNKVREAVGIFALIHSVDSARLAHEIDKEAKRAGKVQDILVQVKTSDEETKSGIRPDELTAFLKEISLYRHISIQGL